MSRFAHWLTGLSDLGITIARKWWRPLVCLGIGGAIFNVGCVLPFYLHAWPDLPGLAALIAAAAPFAYFRSKEKQAGVGES